MCRPKLHDYMCDENETNWRANEIFGGLHPLKLTLQGIFPIEKVQEAHKLIESGLTDGKILLKI